MAGLRLWQTAWMCYGLNCSQHITNILGTYLAHISPRVAAARAMRAAVSTRAETTASAIPMPGRRSQKQIRSKNQI